MLLILCLWVLIQPASAADAPQGAEKYPVSADQLTARKWFMIGDSLTEGLGVTKEEAYPAILQKSFRVQSDPRLARIEIVNAGLSGSTSASAVSRVKWILKGKPSGIVLALGANDGLRGLKPADTKKNLEEAIDLAQAAKVPVILLSMKMPKNYGAEYVKEFDAIFPVLAKKKKLPKPVFLLEGVATKVELNQADGIHPNAKGHIEMAKTVYQVISKWIEKNEKI
ncbi:MAG: arylesterase [Bdellovibrionales bacterium]|nr:arylesterase [Bdellovibrionales bacterium]